MLQLGPPRGPGAARARIEGIEVFGRAYAAVADSLFEEGPPSPARAAPAADQVLPRCFVSARYALSAPEMRCDTLRCTMCCAVARAGLTHAALQTSSVHLYRGEAGPACC